MSEEVPFNEEYIQSMEELKFRLKEVKRYWVYLTTNIINIIASIVLMVILFMRTDNQKSVVIGITILLLIVLIVSFAAMVITNTAGANDPDNEVKQKAKASSYGISLGVFSIITFMFIMGSLTTAANEESGAGLLRNPLAYRTALGVLGFVVVLTFNVTSMSFILGKDSIFRDNDESTDPETTVVDGRRQGTGGTGVSKVLEDFYGKRKITAFTSYLGAVYSGLVVCFIIYLFVRKTRLSKIGLSLMMLFALASLALTIVALSGNDVIKVSHSNQVTTALVIVMGILTLAYLFVEIPKRSKLRGCIGIRPKTLESKYLIKTDTGWALPPGDTIGNVIAFIINAVLGILYVCLRVKSIT